MTVIAVGEDAQRCSENSWYCLKCQPKHEHIAAGHLHIESGLEVLLPRISFRKSTKKGPVRFTEALFPGYLFARFVIKDNLRRVQHTTGVRGVVHFGAQFPTIPTEVIESLRLLVGKEGIHVVSASPEPGDLVRISGGAFHDLQAVVTRVMPARDRIAVLLDFLGRQTTVELAMDSVIAEESPRSISLSPRERAG